MEILGYIIAVLVVVLVVLIVAYVKTTRVKPELPTNPPPDPPEHSWVEPRDLGPWVCPHCETINLGSSNVCAACSYKQH